MIDFPASPTEGLIFQAPGGPQYVYNNGGWRMSGSVNTFLTWPAGVGVDWWGPTAPAGTLLCQGQSLARATYPALFAAIGVAFGAADGASFSLPDCRGRLTAGMDAAGTNRLSTIITNSTVMGGAGGFSHHFLTQTEMPGHAHVTGGGQQLLDYQAAAKSRVDLAGGSVLGGTTLSTVSTSSVGGSGYHNNTQPTIVCNKLITTGGV